MTNPDLVEAVARALRWPAERLGVHPSMSQRTDMARAVIPLIRNAALDEAAAEIEAWFPGTSLDDPRYSAGRSLRDAILALKG